MTISDRAGALLTIDLGAIAHNYRVLRDLLGSVGCAAVVKADAYGLGMTRVAPVLARAGCETFFVATLDEGIALRRELPGAEIAVLNGVYAGTEGEFSAHGLTPVLNDLGQIERWSAFSRAQGGREGIIHLDTGMSRLGLPSYEVDRLQECPEILDGLRPRLVMSHLACAEECDNPMNAEQLTTFRDLRNRLPAAPASLANSSGIFLGRDYHFELARPGVALYGVNPTPGLPNPMAEVVRLQGRIIQVRDCSEGQTVGYGASHRISEPTRLATVAVGYADGYLRSLSNRAYGAVGEVKLAVIGRVSMDLTTLDVSSLPAEATRPGTTVDLIGGACPIDEVAAWAGTIGYEILTGLGRRYARHYVGTDA